LQTYQINHRKIYSILLFIVKRIFRVYCWWWCSCFQMNMCCGKTLFDYPEDGTLEEFLKEFPSFCPSYQAG